MNVYVKRCIRFFCFYRAIGPYFILILTCSNSWTNSIKDVWNDTSRNTHSCWPVMWSWCFCNELIYCLHCIKYNHQCATDPTLQFVFSLSGLEFLPWISCAVNWLMIDQSFIEHPELLHRHNWTSKATVQWKKRSRRQSVSQSVSQSVGQSDVFPVMC
jgi:hypothetical protein